MARRRSMAGFQTRAIIFAVLISTCLYTYLQCSSNSLNRSSLRHFRPFELSRDDLFNVLQKRQTPADQLPDAELGGDGEDGSDGDSDSDSDSEPNDEPVAEQSTPKAIKKHWTGSLAKGCRLSRMLEGEDTEIPPTEWTDFGDLAKYSWSRHPTYDFQLNAAVSGVVYKSRGEGGFGAPSDAGPPQVKVKLDAQR